MGFTSISRKVIKNITKKNFFFHVAGEISYAINPVSFREQP